MISKLLLDCAIQELLRYAPVSVLNRALGKGWKKEPWPDRVEMVWGEVYGVNVPPDGCSFELRTNEELIPSYWMYTFLIRPRSRKGQWVTIQTQMPGDFRKHPDIEDAENRLIWMYDYVEGLFL